jgi:alpha-amylase
MIPARPRSRGAAQRGPNNVFIAGVLASGVVLGALMQAQATPSAGPPYGVADPAPPRSPGLPLTYGGEAPTTIFHAFDESYADVAAYVCDLAAEGYSHVLVAPAQRSNPTGYWWGRYQPIDYRVLEGRGSEADLSRLVQRAHSCGVKILADVVFNHMANTPEYSNLTFPQFTADDFHPPCDIHEDDGNRRTELECRLGGLPDLDQSRANVAAAQKAHLRKLLDLGVDGFRFDSAKNIPPEVLAGYVDSVQRESRGNAWSYLDVVEDGDTKAEDYAPVAPVTDFLFYRALKRAFTAGGDLRSLRSAPAALDARAVSFGRGHDTVREWNANAIDPYDDWTDSYLATAYALARERGTPIVLHIDNLNGPFIRAGVQFRQILRQRALADADVREAVVPLVDSSTLLVLSRGAEGFFVVNKDTRPFDTPVAEVTASELEGCYRELRGHFTVTVERHADGKKYVTRWGAANRAGMVVPARDALFLVRESWVSCEGN